MSLKYAILGLLSEGPRHGYELKGLYDEVLVPSAKLNFGQVYPTLDRLRRDGCVDQNVVSQDDRPDRKVYSITELGRKQLQEWLDTPTELVRLALGGGTTDPSEPAVSTCVLGDAHPEHP